MPENIKILRMLLMQIDESRVDFTIEVISSISEKHQVIHASSLQECVELLTESEYGLIILDLEVPRKSETEVFSHIKESLKDSINEETPIIIISDTKDHKTIRSLLRNGAKDYLIRGEFGAHELKRAIVFATYENHLPKRKKGLRGVLQSYLG